METELELGLFIFGKIGSQPNYKEWKHIRTSFPLSHLPSSQPNYMETEIEEVQTVISLNYKEWKSGSTNEWFPQSLLRFSA